MTFSSVTLLLAWLELLLINKELLVSPPGFLEHNRFVLMVDAHIYRWRWDTKIVISDVDGTITKSDVLGQFMPLVGRDWTQSGVAKIFSAIKENGYQLLFLSASAIVQAYLTRSFLNNLKQDRKALPNVIGRAPHKFKIACLEDIKKLFPEHYNPFFAGFGNRDTDELSYSKLGIPKGNIFIINPKGEEATGDRVDVKLAQNQDVSAMVNASELTGQDANHS
ncbi:hypothetical protein HID58_026165 [Brassica napus]|uniref:LNS2/PITP domain-containing protein n=1 Tax=Brassica napus TaxID=3708 RepID=A0ABQ8CQ49_BRANA|nr:hypothetical protein HID58_026165 [Brassica napus]